MPIGTARNRTNKAIGRRFGRLMVPKAVLAIRPMPAMGAAYCTQRRNTLPSPYKGRKAHLPDAVSRQLPRCWECFYGAHPMPPHGPLHACSPRQKPKGAKRCAQRRKARSNTWPKNPKRQTTELFRAQGGSFTTAIVGNAFSI
jgi:hypothetical protein